MAPRQITTPPRAPAPQGVVALRLGALLLCGALPVAGCVATSVTTSGNEPSGNVRVPEGKADREARFRRQDAEDAAAALEAAKNAVPAPPVTGVITRLQYHRDGCPRLAEAAAPDRATFSSVYLAIDAGFSPCDHCRPGP